MPPRIILVSRDWRLRVLLRAQLLEEGLEVEAFEDCRAALASLGEGEPFPNLLIADLSSSDNPAREADLLFYWVDQFPTWVISSYALAVDSNLSARGFDRVLSRPIGLGDLVKEIRLRV